MTTETLAVADSPNDTLKMSDLTMMLFGHAAFQYLHAGSALGILDLLAENPAGLSREELSDNTGVQGQAMRCLLFGLEALRLITRDDGVYRASPLIGGLIASGQWPVIKDTIAFEAEIVYHGQADFVASLREDRNVGLRRIPGDGTDLYHRLAENERLQAIFYRYMNSWSSAANHHLLAHVDFSRFERVLDVGGGDGVNAIDICRKYPGVSVTLTEIAGNSEMASRRIAGAELEHRIAVVECDMFDGAFPRDVDCVLFAHQLVIWPLESVRLLLQKAFQALRPGGTVVIFSSISDDDTPGPLMAALDSVYFVSIPATRGMIYSWNDYESALSDVGFIAVERTRCASWTPHGIVTAVRPFDR